MYMRYIFGAIVVWLALPLITSAAGFSGGNYEKGLLAVGVTGLSPLPIITVITALMQWLLSIVGFLAIIAFAAAGILYLTSAGDEGQAETAKKTAKYALLGIIVALGGMIVLQAASVLLKGEARF